MITRCYLLHGSNKIGRGFVGCRVLPSVKEIISYIRRNPKGTLTTRAVLCLMGFAGTILGQTTAPRDVDGWGKLKGGLTADQMKAAYGADAKDWDGTQSGDGSKTSDRSKNERLIVPIVVGDLRMEASLFSQGSDQPITRVRRYYLRTRTHAQRRNT